MHNPIKKLRSLGQAIWYDNIERRLIKDGYLKRLIDQGSIYGITSNPSIFQKAIANSADYDTQIQPLSWSGLESDEIFYELAIQDIRDAADLFAEMYHASNKLDGYVSLEVNPLLAHDTAATVKEAQNLWERVDRNNLMVKIPATKAGIPAIRESIAAGINVNVTLIFSIVRYEEVMDAYISGLEDRVNNGLPVENIASVASFFVSRVDTKVDKKIDQLFENKTIEADMAKQISGHAAIANSRLAYLQFLEKFNSGRFESLKSHHARIQRPLWASTSTKNPAYSDVLYVEELVVPDSVNTVPPATLEAFLDHGSGISHIPQSKEPSLKIISQLTEIGIRMEEVTEELEDEGVKSFSDAYISLLETIGIRRKEFITELGDLHTHVESGLKKQKENRTIQKLFAYDASLWSDNDEIKQEITKRLGWIDLPCSIEPKIDRLREITRSCLNNGFTNAVLLGMGGSSLAPEVITKTFGQTNDNRWPQIKLSVLDSTDPDEIMSTLHNLDLEKTLFIVSSKSGTTVETISLMAYFLEKLRSHGVDEPGKHFIAITDPDTPLAAAAGEHGFRDILFANPDVGGRYSALSVFALLPAALIGIDLSAFQQSAMTAWRMSSPQNAYHANPGLLLGTFLGEAHKLGRNKLTLLSDGKWDSFGAWLEQLLAESSGKLGRGIIPIDNEPVFSPEYYNDDRVFIYLKDDGEKDAHVSKLKSAGFPVITLQLHDAYDLAAQFYIWEIATAVACSIIQVNAFDQPNVQESKERSQHELQSLRKNGEFNWTEPYWEDHHFAFRFANLNLERAAANPRSILETFLEQKTNRGYAALNVYLNKDEAILNAIQQIREAVTHKYGLASLFGYGPRYLHSTGQLHKGGPQEGIFMLITRDYSGSLPIPGKNMQFKDLILAQALGDFKALENRGYKVLHIHIKDGYIEAALQQILQYIQ